MSLIRIINLRSLSALIAVTSVLFFTHSTAAQVIGISPPLSGTSESLSSSTSESTLGFSSISANDTNTDRCLEMLDYVRESSGQSDSSGVEMTTAVELSQFNPVWWPRYSTSAEDLVEPMTARFAKQVGMPGLRHQSNEFPAGSVHSQTWLSSIEAPVIGPADSRLVDGAISSDLTNVNGVTDEFSQREVGIRSFLDESPLSAPEPGCFTLIVALSSVSVLFKIYGRNL